MQDINMLHWWVAAQFSLIGAFAAYVLYSVIFHGISGVFASLLGLVVFFALFRIDHTPWGTYGNNMFMQVCYAGVALAMLYTFNGILIGSSAVAVMPMISGGALALFLGMYVIKGAGN